MFTCKYTRAYITPHATERNIYVCMDRNVYSDIYVYVF